MLNSHQLNDLQMIKYLQIKNDRQIKTISKLKKNNLNRNLQIKNDLQRTQYSQLFILTRPWHEFKVIVFLCITVDP